MAPVTLSIAKRLRLDPVPFLIVEAVASNIGGTATLVGDPPNIMIASKAELGYLQFLIVLGPVVLGIMAVFLVCLRLFYGGGMQVAPHLKETLLGLDPRDAVQDPLLLRRCVWLLVSRQPRVWPSRSASFGAGDNRACGRQRIHVDWSGE